MMVEPTYKQLKFFLLMSHNRTTRNNENFFLSIEYFFIFQYAYRVHWKFIENIEIFNRVKYENILIDKTIG